MKPQSDKTPKLKSVAASANLSNVETLRRTVRFGSSQLDFGDSLQASANWPAPDTIIADGPYGLGKFPGEPATTKHLAQWYAPHAAEWSKRAKPGTTLWFWNSEIGWAMVHPMLEAHGWEYQECCVWDKGVAHVAGNCNSKTIRGVPVVTEVAVRYTKKATLPSSNWVQLPIKEWVREEWLRSGLPMNQANEACGVKNAATRKYLTQCHLWYFPPAEAMVKMASYCEENGAPNNGRPYFSLDGKSPLRPEAWNLMRSKWNHAHGLTNVWRAPAVHGVERFKGENGYVHANQKPLALLDIQIRSSTDLGDVVWEPFGGLCSAAVAALRLDRRFFVAEIFPDYFDASVERLAKEYKFKEMVNGNDEQRAA
jgi:site-specific DNA-methyltransferase (adenine-specific)